MGKSRFYLMLYVRKSRIWALGGEVMCKSPGSAVRPPAKSPGFGHLRHISSERIIGGPMAAHESFLVTGGSGLLGQHIVKQLLASKPGATVAVFDLAKPLTAFDKDVRVFTGDITDRHALETAVQEVSARRCGKASPFSDDETLSDQGYMHIPHNRRASWPSKRCALEGQRRWHRKCDLSGSRTGRTKAGLHKFSQCCIRRTRPSGR